MVGGLEASELFTSPEPVSCKRSVVVSGALVSSLAVVVNTSSLWLFSELP